MRIGLLGGSFNPPHAAHRAISLYALKRLQLDRVWWLISPGNPLKDVSALRDLGERAAAAKAMAQDPRIDVTIVGMSKPERIDQTIRLAETDIPDAAWDEIMAVPFDMGEPEANRDMSGYGR